LGMRFQKVCQPCPGLKKIKECWFKRASVY